MEEGYRGKGFGLELGLLVCFWGWRGWWYWGDWVNNGGGRGEGRRTKRNILTVCIEKLI